MKILIVNHTKTYGKRAQEAVTRITCDYFESSDGQIRAYYQRTKDLGVIEYNPLNRRSVAGFMAEYHCGPGGSKGRS